MEKADVSQKMFTGNLGRNFLFFGKIHRNARCRVRWTWKTANCTGEDLTDDDKNALENMKIKIDAL